MSKEERDHPACLVVGPLPKLGLLGLVVGFSLLDIVVFVGVCVWEPLRTKSNKGSKCGKSTPREENSQAFSTRHFFLMSGGNVLIVSCSRGMVFIVFFFFLVK